MRYLEAHAQLINASPLRIVEMAGRTCYKSEDKITDDSHVFFVRDLIAKKHMAMLEHANYTFFDFHSTGWFDIYTKLCKLLPDPFYLRFINVTDDAFSINMRTLIEAELVNDPFQLINTNYNIKSGKLAGFYLANAGDLAIMSKTNKLSHKYITIKVICDRGVTHEIVRHRLAAYAQESTRYCNYCSNKHGDEITLIEPQFDTCEQRTTWRDSCSIAEASYRDLVDSGVKAQIARSVLPNSLKSEIVITMNLREWKHFLDLRYKGITGPPHPQMVEVASLIRNILVNNEPAVFAGY